MQHCWFFLYGFYGSVALYRLYRAGECVVNVRVSGHNPTGEVVPPCTLDQWVDSPPPYPTGGMCRVWWDHTILHSRAVGLFYHPPAHRGQIRHYDIRNLSNSAGEYAVWMHVSACRCPMGLHHSTLSSSGRIISPPRHTGRLNLYVFKYGRTFYCYTTRLPKYIGAMRHKKQNYFCVWI